MQSPGLKRQERAYASLREWLCHVLIGATTGCTAPSILVRTISSARRLASASSARIRLKTSCTLVLADSLARRQYVIAAAKARPTVRTVDTRSSHHTRRFSGSTFLKLAQEVQIESHSCLYQERFATCGE